MFLSSPDQPKCTPTCTPHATKLRLRGPGCSSVARHAEWRAMTSEQKAAFSLETRAVQGAVWENVGMGMELDGKGREFGK